MNDHRKTDDALMMSAETTPEDVRSFLKRRLLNPIEVEGTTVYNFSSFEVDIELLSELVQHKLHKDLYVIPFQVTGVWGWMTPTLPEALQQADVLVYHPSKDDYAAYSNFLAELEGED